MTATGCSVSMLVDCECQGVRMRIAALAACQTLHGGGRGEVNHPIQK